MYKRQADQAVWLVEGFVPGPKSIGVIEAVKMGAKPYPMLPQMGLMHGALAVSYTHLTLPTKDSV